MNRYEFALLRYRHDIASGEFANIGVVLLDTDSRKILHKVSDKYHRVSEFFAGINGTTFHTRVKHLDRALQLCNADLLQPDLIEGTTDSLESVLGEVLPPDESCFEPSGVMYGVTDSPAERIAELFEEFVGRYEKNTEQEGRNEREIGRAVERAIKQSDVVHRVKFAYSIQAPKYEYQFKAGWKNGQTQVLDPISLDLLKPSQIVEKASHWSGRLFNLQNGPPFGFTAIVARPANPKLNNAVNRAMAILRDSPGVRRLVSEEDADEVLEMIRQDTHGQEPG
jgi:hypothetical protein